MKCFSILQYLIPWWWSVWFSRNYLPPQITLIVNNVLLSDLLCTLNWPKLLNSVSVIYLSWWCSYKWKTKQKPQTISALSNVQLRIHKRIISILPTQIERERRQMTFSTGYIDLHTILWFFESHPTYGFNRPRECAFGKNGYSIAPPVKVEENR